MKIFQDGETGQRQMSLAELVSFQFLGIFQAHDKHCFGHLVVTMTATITGLPLKTMFASVPLKEVPSCKVTSRYSNALFRESILERIKQLSWPELVRRTANSGNRRADSHSDDRLACRTSAAVDQWEPQRPF